MASDAPSLAAWVWHLFAGDVVDTRSLRLMIPSDRADFAYGTQPWPALAADAFGTAGGKTGYGSLFVVFPRSHAVVVIFVNDPEVIVEPTVRALLAAATS